LNIFLNEQAQPFKLLGVTGGNEFSVNDVIKINLDELCSLYYSTIPKIMNRREQ